MSKGNLLITFIILIALSLTIFSFLSFIAVRLRESGTRVTGSEAFYVAEAGLNKAVWYMATPVAQGGKGFSWRAADFIEQFGKGGYHLTVMDSVVTNEVLIISTGEVGNISEIVSEIVRIGGLPAAFDYAVYCNSGVNFSGNVNITGDLYVSSNTTFSSNSSVTDGYVYHPAGTTLSGSGTWTDGGAPSQVVGFPPFDSSYYDGLINYAQGVASGNKTYSNTTVNLNGGTVYVNGNVTISGNTTFTGPGVIVSTGTMNISGNTYGSGSVKFIANNTVTVTGNTYTSGSTYYSATSLSASGNTRVDVGAFITKGAVSLSGNLNLSGMVYAASGASFVSGNPTIRGSLVASAFSTFSGNSNIYFDTSYLQSDVPSGFAASSLSIKKGSWKGDQ